jgi:release factor glutamine methyltransferase
MTPEPLLRATLRRLVAAGIPGDEARAEARLLLAHALGVSREELRLRPDRALTEQEAARFDDLIARRARRAPLAYLTGAREFYGLAFAVTPAVLIPRPETEFVVEAVLRHIAGSPAPRIADVGTGSGCIAVAVAVHAPGARVWATDISPAALAVAAENAERHGVAGRLRFLEGDLLAPLAAFAPFDAIVSNPPYIGPGEIAALPPEVRDWEPRAALTTGNEDALLAYRRLADGAPALLSPGGLLAVEVGLGQAEAVADLWRGAGLGEIAVLADYAGIGRVVTGVRR